jgi:hypothetical protein
VGLPDVKLDRAPAVAASMMPSVAMRAGTRARRRVLFSTTLPVAAASGSAIAADEAGGLTIIPGAAPKAAGPAGTFAGSPASLVFVPQTL